jgi:SAM-dependent methyltransferase
MASIPTHPKEIPMFNPAALQEETATATDAGERIEGSAFSAAVYEPFLWLGERRGMRDRRRRLLSEARGRVLEIGAGTGLNVQHYPEGIETLVLAEPVEEMAQRIDASERAPAPVSVVLARAEELPFGDSMFDTVVSTMVLCTVEDVAATLTEIRRVLAPGGRFLFCEHVRSDKPRLARWQDRLAGPWASFAEGCMCNRDTLAAIDAHLEIERVERETWRGMAPLVHPLVIGAAR